MADQAKKAVADAQFRKLQRVVDGKRAMSEYEAEQAATNAKTARLKAERLAREAAAKAAPAPTAATTRAAITPGGKRKLTRT